MLAQNLRIEQRWRIEAILFSSNFAQFSSIVSTVHRVKTCENSLRDVGTASQNLIAKLQVQNLRKLARSIGFHYEEHHEDQYRL